LAFLGFENWPNDVVQLDLGDRPVQLIPSPGHHPDHLVFYDERTGLLLSGDFLLPGRLLIEDIAAYRESADRVIAFLENRPVAHILGSHLELDVDGNLYPFRSQYPPEQRSLQLSREDLVALSDALHGFNGYYSRHENFVLTNPTRNLWAVVGGVLVALTLIAWGVVWFVRRRRGIRVPALT
jgi:hydroxyacylglutathione hydrolase